MINEVLTNRYIRDLSKNKVLIITITFIIMFWSIVYLFVFHESLYESKAKILIKDMGNESLLTDYASQSMLKSLTSAGNPLLTQKEIIQSKQLEHKIQNYIKEKFPNSSYKNFVIKKNVKVKLKPATDVISISLKWLSPEESKQLLVVALNEYKNINISIKNKLKEQRRIFLDLKFEEVDEKLKKIRNEIKNYKSQNLVSDIRIENQKMIMEKVRLSSEIENLNALIDKSSALKTELKNKLNLDYKEAINAVALGEGNTILTKLRNDLNEANQKYQFDIIKYADTNPKIVALKSRIQIIQDQIKNQIEISIGKYVETDRKFSIYDPVRQSMINNLVKAETDYISYQAQKKSILKSLNKINLYISKQPQKQLILANFKQEENNLSNAYDEISLKRMEAKIQEAETVSNISIIDEPSLPDNPSFPTTSHIICLSVLTGLGFGFLASFFKTLLEDVCDEIDYIEKVTKSSILGIVPWLNDKDFDIDKAEYMNKIAYSNILSSLMSRCYRKKVNILTFTSTSVKRPHSTAMNNLAERLINLGRSVVIVDTDFRIPASHAGSDLAKEIKVNFSDLILYAENQAKNKRNMNERKVLDALVKDSKGIYHLLNREFRFEPYDYFGTAGYSLILKILGENFDWVLIDTSAAHISPEFSMIAKRSGGVVLFVNKTATYLILNQVTKTLESSHIPIIGAIVRKANPEMEKAYDSYVEHHYKRLLAEEGENDYIFEETEPVDLEV